MTEQPEESGRAAMADHDDSKEERREGQAKE
jgi:hypothetical protein